MNKHKFEIRCHELSNIMAEPKAKTSTKTHKVKTEKGEIIDIKLTDPSTKEKDVLSEGAKTYIETMARRYVYKYTPSISNKYLDKGIWVEDDSINLYNQVFFTNLTKNKERKTIEIAPNCFLSGEWDLEQEKARKIIDIKSPWSTETFPETKKIALNDAKKAGYDWQLRGYLILRDYDLGEVAYCLVNTPSDLLRDFEADLSMHNVDHISPALRVTTCEFKRDSNLDEKIKERIIAASIYFNQVINEIYKDHLI